MEARWGRAGDNFDGTVDVLGTARLQMDDQGSVVTAVEIEWALSADEADLLEVVFAVAGGQQAAVDALLAAVEAELPWIGARLGVEVETCEEDEEDEDC